MRRDGFTLMEAMIAMAVLALSVAAIAQAITAGHAQTADSLHRAKAVALADALMEEVLSKPYGDPNGVSVAGPDAGETSRALFDNIDDYHGYVPPAADPAVSDVQRVGYGSEYAGFTRTVTVQLQNSVGPRGVGVVAGVMITVTVRDERGNIWQVSRFVEAPA